MTKKPRDAIIKTQKGSEKNEKSSKVKFTRQEIAETHSPKVMHIRAGQQCDRVLSEVRRRVESVGILAHFLRRVYCPCAPNPHYTTSPQICQAKNVKNFKKFFIPKLGRVSVLKSVKNTCSVQKSVQTVGVHFFGHTQKQAENACANCTKTAP